MMLLIRLPKLNTAASLSSGKNPNDVTNISYSVLQLRVARQCLSLEATFVLSSWSMNRSGFSVFVGDPLTLAPGRASRELFTPLQAGLINGGAW
jgi:hypothetical protein